MTLGAALWVCPAMEAAVRQLLEGKAKDTEVYAVADWTHKLNMGLGFRV